jgi:RHS repeat-associated protein
LYFAGTTNESAAILIAAKPVTVTATTNKFSGTAAVGSGTSVVTVTATDGSGNTRTNQYEVTLSGTSTTLNYDANGNLTGDGTRTFTWDAENRLLSISIGTRVSELTYDGLDRRVRIVEKDSGSTTNDKRFLWCGLQLCEERDPTGGTVDKRFFEQGVQDGGTAFFYTKDHLGSVRELTDSSEVLRGRYDYDPSGRRTKIAGNKDVDAGFTGHYEHTPSGLTLAPFRAYDANSGRWISEDPIGLNDGINLFSYASNDPIGIYDPTGENGLLAIPSVWGVGAMATLPGWVGPAALAVVVLTTVVVAANIYNKNHSDTVKPPFTGPPGSTFVGDKQTRRFGKDGYPDTDVDTGHNHKGPKGERAGDPHSHDWSRPKDGRPPTDADRSVPRPYLPGDPALPNSCPVK